MAEPEYQDALVKEDKAFSIIWLLPLIAVVIGGWLLYRAVVEAPIEISINFPSGTGMEVAKPRCFMKASRPEWSPIYSWIQRI